jgi:hypothetical protein
VLCEGCQGSQRALSASVPPVICLQGAPLDAGDSAVADRYTAEARRMPRSRRSRLTLLLLMWNCSASSRAVVPAL